jgi:hypothetical protein
MNFRIPSLTCFCLLFHFLDAQLRPCSSFILSPFQYQPDGARYILDCLKLCLLDTRSKIGLLWLYPQPDPHIASITYSEVLFGPKYPFSSLAWRDTDSALSSWLPYGPRIFDIATFAILFHELSGISSFWCWNFEFPYYSTNGKSSSVVGDPVHFQHFLTLWSSICTCIKSTCRVSN